MKYKNSLSPKKSPITKFSNNLIEAFDLFGYPITFNINGFSKKYKTLHGLAFSIFVYYIYGYYLSIVLDNVMNGNNT